MARSRVVRVQGVGPNHPPRRSSAATMGMRTREDGAESTVQMRIDLGLKTDELGYIEMSYEQAVSFATDILVAAKQVAEVNTREQSG